MPNYPPHLISNEEMCEAFLTNPVKYQQALNKALEDGSDAPYEISYFKHVYRLVNRSMEDEYEVLMNAFRYHIARFLTSVESFYSDLPDWVYSYMMGHVIANSSSAEDRHYFLTGINRDNIDDIMTSESQEACYEVSKRYINNLSRDQKYVELAILLKNYSTSEKATILNEFKAWGVTILPDNSIFMRPPSMFGEQNIIKIIRLSMG